jgi:hypothetical protein
MSVSLVLCLSLTCVSGEPPAPSDFVPKARALDEQFHRDHLQMVRRGRALLESNIELFEKLLAEGPIRFTPEGAAQLRREIGVWRAEVEKSKKYERELERWEQQRKLKPGLETDLAAIERITKLHRELWPKCPVAPMPREVKPRNTGAKP